MWIWCNMKGNVYLNEDVQLQKYKQNISSVWNLHLVSVPFFTFIPVVKKYLWEVNRVWFHFLGTALQVAENHWIGRLAWRLPGHYWKTWATSNNISSEYKMQLCPGVWQFWLVVIGQLSLKTEAGNNIGSQTNNIEERDVFLPRQEQGLCTTVSRLLSDRKWENL